MDFVKNNDKEHNTMESAAHHTEPHIPQVPALWELSVVIAATVVFVILVSVVFFLFSLKYSVKTEFLLAEGLLIIPAVIYVIIKKYSLREIFRFNRVNGREMRFAVVVGISLILIINYVENLLRLIPFPEEFTKQKQLFEQGLLDTLIITNIYDFIIITAAVVVIAAAAEEMLFRGFIQRTFEHKLPLFWAITITALLFTFLHPFSVIPILPLAVILGIISWRSRSIIPSIIIHGINNGLSLYALNTNPELQADPSKGVEVSLPVVIISIVIFVVSFRYYFIMSGQSEEVEDAVFKDE